MKVLSKMAWVIFSNRFHVSLLPVALTLFWQMALRLPLPLSYYVMIALHTLAGYWVNMITDQAEDVFNYPEQGRVFRPGSSWIRIGIAACWCLGFWLALRAGWRMVLFGTLSNCLGLLYGLQIRLPSGREFRIKSIPWLKNAYSALLWSAGLILAPFVYLNMSLNRLAPLVILISFLLVFFVELLWDLRDVRGDRQAGVCTIPISLGESTTRLILHLVNAAACLVAVASLVGGLLPPSYWILVPNALASSVIVEWYVRLKDRQLASHLYLLYGGCVIAIALGIDKLSSPPFVISRIGAAL
jgi:4-hydroxybenzoate polyprenyltransferase